jgi:hypothetical protein
LQARQNGFEQIIQAIRLARKAGTDPCRLQRLQDFSDAGTGGNAMLQQFGTANGEPRNRCRGGETPCNLPIARIRRSTALCLGKS